MIVIPDNREGFSMRVSGVQINRPDLHILAAELGITTRDVLMENGVLTIYNTSKTCQEIIDDNALLSFVAMVFDISTDSLSELTPVKAKPRIIERDLEEEDED